MSFTESVKSFFANYANFSDRASRSELWWTILFYFLATFAVSLISVIFASAGGFEGVIIIQLIWAVGTAVPLLSLYARRLHDVGHTGWLQLLYMIPFIGFILFIYWGVLESDGYNQWGAPVV